MKTVYPERGRRVFVGLSGGVDSAVSAALLKERGYDVVGAFIKIWRPEFTECTWKEDRLDAMRVAAALGIPFREVDLSDEYKKEVVDSMVRDYARGVTPNPDVLCNREIKFGRFYRWAREQGADFVATGHYARIGQKFGFTKPKYDSGFVNPNILLRGKDIAKDQSYFLHQINGADLGHILFPIGELQKSEVRKLAVRFNLPVAMRPDSQGLCFVGDISMNEFLGRFMSLTPGPVINTEGKIVGEHKGAALYTVGQRHGFTVSKNGEPYYVMRTDLATNTIFVSHSRDDAAQSVVLVRNMHWVNSPVEMPCEALAQARYRETPVAVRLENGPDALRVTFHTPHIVAPGQSLVIYHGDECVGGGIISL